MNKKEERSSKVLIEGNKTPEGRLKIEKIKKYQRDSEDYKVNAIFYGVMSFIEFVMRDVICITLRKENVVNLIPFCLIPLFIHLYQKIKVDKEIYRLEDEILDKIDNRLERVK